MPYYRRGNRWRVHVSRYVNGKRQQITRTVATEREAKSLEVELLDTLDAGRDPDGRHTVAELLDLWMETAPHAETTKGTIESIVERHLKPTFEHEIVETLKAETVMRAFARMTRLDGEPLAPSAKATYARKLHAALELAIELEWITKNPAAKALKNITLDPTNPKAPTVAEVQAFIDAARSPWIDKASALHEPDLQLALFIRLAAVTGMRRGELLALRDSSFSGDQVTIAASVGRVKGAVVIVPTKTHKIHNIALDMVTLAELDAHRERRRELCEAMGGQVAEDPFVFSSYPDGSEPWFPTSPTTSFARLSERAGVKISPHDLRHFACTELLSGKIDAKTVSTRASHSKVGTTTDLYAAARPANDQEAANLLGALLS